MAQSCHINGEGPERQPSRRRADYAHSKAACRLLRSPSSFFSCPIRGGLRRVAAAEDGPPVATEKTDLVLAPRCRGQSRRGPASSTSAKMLRLLTHRYAAAAPTRHLGSFPSEMSRRQRPPQMLGQRVI